MFCGSTKDLQVDHIDGFEEHGEPENLLWLCRSCNQLKSAVFVDAGIGRRTKQYNPSLLFSSLYRTKEQSRLIGNPWKRLDPREIGRRLTKERAEVDARRRGTKRVGVESQRHYSEVGKLIAGGMSLRQALDAVGNPARGFARYKGFIILQADGPVYSTTLDPDSWHENPAGARRMIDYFKNPASSAADWSSAVSILRGDIKGSPFRAARMVRSTPIARRYQYLDKMMRLNPGPTFEQYAWAIQQGPGGMHHGPYRKGGFSEGAHDEAGAIIHATSKAKRRQYADKIAGMKSGRKEGVPF